MKPGAAKTFSAFGFTQLLMVVAIGFALFLAYDPWRWGQVREELLAKFPNVDRIEGAMLERWVAEVKGDPTKVGPQILDVRSEAEYRVSHIPGGAPRECGRDAGGDAFTSYAGGPGCGFTAPDRGLLHGRI